MAVRVLLTEFDEKPSVDTNVDKTLCPLPDGNCGDDRIRHEHDVCHKRIIDGSQQS
jgi:hypothetical protein